MEKLPLFPLNTVLFPGMPISLHIFEERYKLMIGECIARRQPFGVILLRQGSAEEKPGQVIEPFLVGCSAEITQVQPATLGRMNIVAIGQERFQVQRFEKDQPYLVGLVDWLAFTPGAGFDRVFATDRLTHLVNRYLDLAGRFEKIELDRRALPSDPLQLAFFGVSILRAPMEDKQGVLQAASDEDVVANAARLLRREVALLDLTARPVPGETDGVFSVN